MKLSATTAERVRFIAGGVSGCHAEAPRKAQGEWGCRCCLLTKFHHCWGRMTSTLTIQARFAVLALQRLLTGLPVAAACFLAGLVVASAQTPPAVAARAPGDEVIKMQAFVSTGTRFNDRTVTDSPVPIDVVTDFEIRATGLTEPAQVLQRLVPSVNFPRTSIADGTDSARPLTLRGLAPDQ